MRKDVEAMPFLELVSIEELTPEMFVTYEASRQESLGTAEGALPRASDRTGQQLKARKRMQQDLSFSDQERQEIESLYQVANKQWQTQEARDSLNTLVEKYKRANRTGCAILYLGQMSHGDEQIAYFKQAITDHSDCFYGDGVQVGAFARFLLGQVYVQSGQLDLAEALFNEIRKEFRDSIDHSGNSLVAQLPPETSIRQMAPLHDRETSEAKSVAEASLSNRSHTEAAKAALESAEAWLALVDQGQYEQSWDAASERFKNAISKQDWAKSLAAVRKPLGEVKSRNLNSKQYTTTLPGAPDGEYVVLQYTTSFADKESATETVTSMFDKDKKWKVSGYFIK
jgi:hypothetical protein